jgi:hypothetical protein
MNYSIIIKDQFNEMKSHFNSGQIIGTLDPVGDGMDIRSISHLVEDIEIINDEPVVLLKALDTDQGKILKELVKAGIELSVKPHFKSDGRIITFHIYSDGCSTKHFFSREEIENYKVELRNNKIEDLLK